MRDIMNIFNTDLYCILGEEFSNGKSNIDVTKELISAGIKIIQYREKTKTPRYKYEQCLEIRDLTKQADVTFIVNDDIDIAILTGADGVHIGQEDIPIEKVRQLVGEDMIIGLSTHTPYQAQDAVARNADYIGVGPIFPTSTKKDVGDAVGLDYLGFVSENIDIPFVAIGGIKEYNISEVASRGARCICMITEIIGSCYIQEKVKMIRTKLNNG